MRKSKKHTGVDAIKFWLNTNQKTQSWFADQLGITRGAFLQWDTVPAERMRDVYMITGITHEIQRPDLFKGRDLNAKA